MKLLLTTSITLLLHLSNAFVPTVHRSIVRSKDVHLSLKNLPSFTFNTRSQMKSRMFSSVTDASEKQTAEISMDPKHNFLGDSIPYSELTIGVMKETFPGECRVSQSPESVKKLVDAGFDVVVQAGGKNILKITCWFVNRILTFVAYITKLARRLRSVMQLMSRLGQLFLVVIRYLITPISSLRFVLPTKKKCPS